eukprot:TRINITY_DN4349_c0_g1_i6.p1 TRINITY_DN4349_c0_g1~~TRINITY_DN4349_c0_g1_i6.p1  ORF type:complete len:252 (-),score=48.43 TRINITY_DN4349_c0_g1_i6:139-894(-)
MNEAFTEITSARMARLVGLVIHFVYWSVFGHFNQIPIDTYSKTSIFFAIQKIINDIMVTYNTSMRFSTFFMPMIVLTIRRKVDGAFHAKYPLVFKEPVAGKVAMNCISLLLTKLLDPNVLYSRFSSLESNDKAITAKLKQHFSSKGTKIQDLFFTNSPLVSSLLPQNSEGKIRALFMDRSKLMARGKDKTRKSANLPPISPRTMSDTRTVDERAKEMANSIQMCNVAFKRIDNNLSKRRLNGMFNILKLQN